MAGARIAFAPFVASNRERCARVVTERAREMGSSIPAVRRLVSQRWPWIAAAALVLLLWASSLVDVRIGDADPRPLGSSEDLERLSQRTDLNVVFILIDTLRADHLGAYGYERPTSPTLDLLAARGVRFANHLAQSSWTKASMASLWTGVLPARTGVLRFEHVLSPDAKMPAEILSEAGFRTTALYRNGWVSPYFGFAQGFDFYERPGTRPVPASVRIENPTIQKTATDSDTLAAAMEFLRTHGAERFFLYLHLMDVHEYVYDDEHAVFGSEYVDIYDNAILRLNSALDQLLAYLAEHGQLEKTVIAIASDHGEAFGERGLEGHARFVYRETTEVPFILSLPFRLEPGIVLEGRTRNVDLWPTLLDLLGLPAMPDTDGRSLLPDIVAAGRGEVPVERESFGLAHLDRNWGRRDERPLPTVAVTEGPLRYVYTPERGGRPTTERLFDRSLDPRELEDLSRERPEDVERLRARARAYLENSTTAWTEAESLEIDEMQLNQLRALGYQIP
jgi:arylsulfatase A-like enzyme